MAPVVSGMVPQVTWMVATRVDWEEVLPEGVIIHSIRFQEMCLAVPGQEPVPVPSKLPEQ